jgi:hypothetical protein
LAGAIVAVEAETPRVTGAAFDTVPEVHYPESPAVINVKQAPYNAQGDGKTDDTAALQRALNENVGRHKVLYFPSGTYLISQTLTWPKRFEGRDNWGMTMLRGQHPTTTKLQLQDGTFTNPAEPKAMMWCGGFGSADWFHNYVEGLTFDVGADNPGAIALQFYSNNSGAVRDCRFLAPAGSGLIGLDLGHRDMNGPVLIKNCEVVGFRRGISCGHAVNSQTFEQITLRGQSEVGFQNQGQAISVRRLVSENAVPSVSTYGVFCLIEAKLTGRDAASRVPAMINYNGGKIYLRDITTSGYKRALGDVRTPDYAAALRIDGPDKLGSEGPNVREYCSHPFTSPFGDSGESLRLAIKETPTVREDEVSAWANVDKFGADPSGQKDSAAAIQAAIDSGATTVFFPGNYALKSTVIVRGKVRRLVGTGGWLDYTRQAKPDLRIVDGDAPVVMLEHFASIHGGVELDTRRTIVFKSVADCDLTNTLRAQGGEIFCEDFVTHHLALKGQKLWARQLNIENEGTHLVNNASDLWVLGYKTERGGTLLETRGGGRSEILGGFSYTTTAGKLAPMFVTRDSSVFAFFHEVCFNGDPFATLIDEWQGDERRRRERGQGATTPYRSKRAPDP